MSVTLFLLMCLGGLVIFKLLLTMFRGRVKTKNVCIVVLNYTTKCQRMQYHALSFAKEGYNVELIAYPGSPLKRLEKHPNIKIYYLHKAPYLFDSKCKFYF